MDYLISRHIETRDWMAQHGHEVTVSESCDKAFLAALEPGDRVYGNLPSPLVAEVSGRGARYFHIEMPRLALGAELSGKDMQSVGARLVEVRAWRPDPVAAEIYHIPEDQARPLGPRLKRFALLFVALAVLSHILSLSYDALIWGAEQANQPGALMSHMFLSALLLLVAGAIAWGLWQHRHRLLHLSIEMQPVNWPRRGVVLGPSHLPVDQETDLQALVAALREVGLTTLSKSTAEYSDELERSQGTRRGTMILGRNSWQQSFRVLATSLSRLEVVVVICSSGDRGSHSQFKYFRDAAEQLFAQEGRVVQVVAAPGGAVDFESHNDVRASFHRGIRLLADRFGIMHIRQEPRRYPQQELGFGSSGL